METTQPRTNTLSQLIGRFVSRRNLAERTRQYYALILRNLEWYATTNRWPELEAVTREHIRDFLSYVATETYRWPGAPRSSYHPAAPATIHHYGQVVKTFFNWAEEEEYLDHNPGIKVKLGSPRYRDVEPYSDDQVRAMLDLCNQDARLRYRYLGLRNKAIISLFVATGLRLRELAEINLHQIDPRLQEIQVIGKGAKVRAVPVNGEARKALRGYLQVRPDGGDELWRTDDGQPMAVRSVKIMVTRLKKRADINGGGGAHRFRHYFATRYLEAGGDINSLRILLGHSSLAMVLKYSKFVDVRKVLANHEQFDPLDRLVRGPKKDEWRWRY